jgi:hypothetical protein
LGIIHIFFKKMDRVMGKQEKKEADNKVIRKVRRLGGTRTASFGMIGIKHVTGN